MMERVKEIIRPIGYEVKMHPNMDIFAFDLYRKGRLLREKMSYNQVLDFGEQIAKMKGDVLDRDYDGAVFHEKVGTIENQIVGD